MILQNILKKCLLVLIVLATISINSNIQAQNKNAGNTSSSGKSDPNKVPHKLNYGQIEDDGAAKNKKSYESTLYKVSLDTFENGGDFTVRIPSNFGLASLLTQKGAPNKLKGSKDDSLVTPKANPTLNPSDPKKPATKSSSGYFVSEVDKKSKILGVKVNLFAGRKPTWFRIDAVQPIPLEGLVKGFQLWVTGRNAHHELFVIVSDIHGNEQLISLGTLNFIGWKKLNAQVPSFIEQSDPLISLHRGLTFKGFLVKMDLKEAYGNFFIYFDNLSVELSRYVEENILSDNPKDTW